LDRQGASLASLHTTTETETMGQYVIKDCFITIAYKGTFIHCHSERVGDGPLREVFQTNLAIGMQFKSLAAAKRFVSIQNRKTIEASK
jgi:cystathionine beta-lyase family protein involved in aluminum resistance